MRHRDWPAPETTVFEVEQYLESGMYAHAAALAPDLEAPPLAPDDCSVAGRDQAHYVLTHLRRRTFAQEALFALWMSDADMQRST